MISQSKEDEMNLKTALVKAGFSAQMRFRSLLNPPVPSVGAAKIDADAWDYWQDGRIAFLNATIQESGSNIFMANSDLCYIKRLRGSVNIISTADMLHYSEAEVWPSPSTRAAQRGPAWWEAVLSALLCSPPVDDFPAGRPWVTQNDHINILDVHPYIGDGLVASWHVMQNLKFPCSLRHLSASLGYKHNKESATFAMERMEKTLSKHWCDGTATLFKVETNAKGELVQKIVRAKATVCSPEPQQLQAIPGCYQAYHGLTKLEWEICRMTPTGLIKIAPEKMMEFNGANDLVKKTAKELETDHVKNYESLLIHMMTDNTKPTQPGADPRQHEEEGQEVEVPEGDSPETTFKSEEDLKKAVDIVAEAKMFGMHNVRMLRSASGQVWAVCNKDNQAVPKHTIMGAYGAGKVREIPEGAMTAGRHVPFDLPLGDRTPIILAKKAPKEEHDEDDSIDFKVPETVYKATKALMKANNGAAVKLAGMGTLIPETQGAGKHGYVVEFPKGHAKHAITVFELKAESGSDKKVTSGNFFMPLAHPNGLTGSMGHVWRASFKPVHEKICLVKPFVNTTKTVHLLKDVPKFVGGPANKED